MAKLIWGVVAASDVEGIYDYIARDSHQYAKHQVERIFQSTERLQSFPESGRRIPEFPNLPHREIIVDNYRVVYRYADDIGTVTVVHGRRVLKEGNLM